MGNIPDYNEYELKEELREILISDFKAGATMPENIYATNKSRLFLKRNAVLDDELIKKIKKFTHGSNSIYITESTYFSLVENGTIDDTAARQQEMRKLEDETGYSEIKEETLDLLDEIAQDKVLPQDALYSVSSELSNRLESTSASTILSLINALAPVDEYLQRHCINVSLLNGLIGMWMNLPKEVVDHLVLIGLLHDCGKAMIPAKILNAPRKLTAIEFAVIKNHPINSFELLHEFPELVRSAARGHHEKFNGQGYPDGLSGDDIPVEAQITAVADIYDAMVSQRAYKKQNSPFSVMALLEKLAGTDLDSKLVDVFNENMPLELTGKMARLSNGMVGMIHSFDPDDIEYPVIELNKKLVKTNAELHCVSMY